MDGSETLHNDTYDEYYHSKSGAVEEAFEKYVKPCRIRELAKSGHVKILDIGFGLGYTAIAAIDASLEANPNCEIEILSFEKDESIFKELKNLNPPLKNYFLIVKLEYDPKTEAYYYEDRNIFLKIKIGDASDLIKKTNGKFDAVFLDPFSPSKNPELWSKDFFSEIRKRVKPESVLATYSCARKVRENLKEAGFFVYDGPVVGRRSPCTLAKLN